MAGKKIVKVFDGKTMCGIVFDFMGAFFLAIGIMGKMNLSHLERSAGRGENPELAFMIFAFLGLVFLIVGSFFSFQTVMEVRRKKALLKEGYYIMACVTDLCQDTSISYNGHNPYYVKCRYVDEMTGICHVFRSELMKDGDPDMIGQEVKVYLNKNDFDNYVVSIDDLAKNIYFH